MVTVDFHSSYSMFIQDSPRDNDPKQEDENGMLYSGIERFKYSKQEVKKRVSKKRVMKKMV